MIRDFFKHSSIYDDCRRPRRVAPAADQVINNSKITLPAVPRRGPEAGFHRLTLRFSWFGCEPHRFIFCFYRVIFLLKSHSFFLYPAFFQATPAGIDCQSKIEEAPVGRMGIKQDLSVVQEPWLS